MRHHVGVMSGQFQNARLGMDLLPAMQTNIVDRAARASGPAAKRFGFKDCARTGNWEHIDS
jgi:hypothetical protein